MPARSIAGQELLLQGETTPGTAATTAMRRYLSLRARPGWDGASEPYSGGTGKIPTTVLLNDETGMWTMEGVQDYNSLGAVCASRIAIPVTTPTADPNGFQHVFDMNPDAVDTVRTYTAQWGDATQAVQGVYGVFNSLGLSIVRGTLGLDTTFISKAPTTGISKAGGSETQTLTIGGTATGGTFTLSFNGFTTQPPLAYNVTASAVDSALEALPSVGTGNVTCGGGPFPGTPITVQFTGALANRNQPMIITASSLTGTAPTLTATQTVAGNPSDFKAVPISPKGYNVYADDTWATLGTTQMLAMYEGNINFGDKFVPDAPINSAIVSYESLLEAMEQDYGSDFRMGFDATALTVMNSFSTGSLKFFRWEVIGPLIGSGVNYKFTLDCSMFILSRGEFSEAPNSPAVTVPFTATVGKDAVSGKAVRVTLINDVPSY